VREALVWVGCADPCETVEKVLGNDPKRDAAKSSPDDMNDDGVVDYQFADWVRGSRTRLRPRRATTPPDGRFRLPHGQGCRDAWWAYPETRTLVTSMTWTRRTPTRPLDSVTDAMTDYRPL
jgi:hypothetical protein